MANLPDDAKKYLEAAIRLAERSGFPLSFDEVGREAGHTRRAARLALRKVKGVYVDWVEGKARTLRILKRPDGRPFTYPPAENPVRSATRSPARLPDETAARRSMTPVTIVGRVAAGPLRLVTPDVDPQPLLYFLGDSVYVEVHRLTEDDPAHNAKKGDTVITAQRMRKKGDWLVKGWPVLAIYRQF